MKWQVGNVAFKRLNKELYLVASGHSMVWWARLCIWERRAKWSAGNDLEHNYHILQLTLTQCWKVIFRNAHLSENLFMSCCTSVHWSAESQQSQSAAMPVALWGFSTAKFTSYKAVPIHCPFIVTRAVRFGYIGADCLRLREKKGKVLTFHHWILSEWNLRQWFSEKMQTCMYIHRLSWVC